MPRFHASLVCCDANGLALQTCQTKSLGYYATEAEAHGAGYEAARRVNRVLQHESEFYTYRVRVVADDGW